MDNNAASDVTPVDSGDCPQKTNSEVEGGAQSDTEVTNAEVRKRMKPRNYRRKFNRPNRKKSTSSSQSNPPKSRGRRQKQQQQQNSTKSKELRFPNFRQTMALLAKGLNGSPKYREMSPEATLVQFISTSAGFFDIPRQSLETLEDDILRVFDNNVLPANAAAWYMAKRKYYLDRPLEHQLLPSVLNSHPKQFRVHPGNGAVKSNVQFLEKYEREVAQHKLNYLVHQGLFGYFSHKVEEHGVYFFDPIFYEETEPFRSNLMLVTGKKKKSGLVEAYFNLFRKQFHFEKHSMYLMSVTKVKTQRVTNQIGVVVSTLNKDLGLIRFATKDGGHDHALFNLKCLYYDGVNKNLDLNNLPHIQFDGYKVPSNGNGDRKYDWFAVLVWSGRKPSPMMCATREMLQPATPSYFHNKSVTYEELAEIAGSGQQLQETALTKTTQQAVDDGMKVGEVVEILPNGANVALHKQPDKKYFIPGWAHKALSFRGQSGRRRPKVTTRKELTMEQGGTIGKGDLIAFYVGLINRQKIGHNVIILRRAEPGQKALTADEVITGKEKSDKNKKKQKKEDGKKARRNRTSESGVSESKSTSEKSGKRVKKRRTTHLRFLLSDDLLEEDGYVSDTDPPYIPPTTIERELEYDEYSGDEDISDSEEKDLLADSKLDLDQSQLKIPPKEDDAAVSEENKPEDPEEGEIIDKKPNKPKRLPYWLNYLAVRDLDEEPEKDVGRLFLPPYSVQQQIEEEGNGFRDMYNFRHPRIQFPVEEKQETEPEVDAPEDDQEGEPEPDEDELTQEEADELLQDKEVPLEKLCGDYLAYLAEEAAKAEEVKGNQHVEKDESSGKSADLPTAAEIASVAVY